MSKGKEGDLPHLLPSLQDSVATRQRALCFSTSTTKATSKSSSESTLQEQLPTASALTVSEQVYSHSDTTHDRCLTSGKDHSTPLRWSVITAMRRITTYYVNWVMRCIITTPPLRMKIGVWVLSAVGLTRLSMCLGRHLVVIMWHLVVISGDSRLNSLINSEEKNDTVYRLRILMYHLITWFRPGETGLVATPCVPQYH